MAETVAPPRVAGATDGRAERLVVAFAQLLRGAGLDVPLDAVLSCGAALTLTGVRDRDAAYWAMHATLVRRHEDTPVFDRAFAAFWDAREAPHAEPPTPPAPLTLALDAEDGADGDPEPPDAERQPSLEVRFSAVERLRTKDFADYDARELREAQRLMRRLRLAGTPRRSMRLVAAPRRGRHDLDRKSVV